MCFNESGNWWPYGTNSSVSSGTTIEMVNTNFSNYSTTYYWSVNVSDGMGNWCNESYIFTTQALIVMTITLPYPSNNSNNIPLQPWAYATFGHNNGNIMNISWYNDTGILGNETDVFNGTYYELFLNATTRSTDYILNITMWDGEGNWLNETFYFKTEGYGGGGGPYPNYAMPMALAGCAMIIGIFALLMRRRKKRYRR